MPKQKPATKQKKKLPKALKIILWILGVLMCIAILFVIESVDRQHKLNQMHHQALKTISEEFASLDFPGSSPALKLYDMPCSYDYESGTDFCSSNYIKYFGSNVEDTQNLFQSIDTQLKQKGWHSENSYDNSSSSTTYKYYKDGTFALQLTLDLAYKPGAYATDVESNYPQSIKSNYLRLCSVTIETDEYLKGTPAGLF